MRHFVTREYELIVVTDSNLTDAVAYAVSAIERENRSFAEVHDNDGVMLGTVWYAHGTDTYLYAGAGDFPRYREYIP